MNKRPGLLLLAFPLLVTTLLAASRPNSVCLQKDTGQNRTFAPGLKVTISCYNLVALMDKAKSRNNPDGTYIAGLGEQDWSEKAKAMNDLVVDASIWEDPQAAPMLFAFKNALEDLGHGTPLKMLRFLMKYEWRDGEGLLRTASSASSVVLTQDNKDGVFRVIVDPADGVAGGPPMPLKVVQAI